MRYAAPVALALALFSGSYAAAQPGAESGWHQLGGNPHREGVAELGEGPLDVVDAFSFLGPNETWGTRNLMGLVPTPHGLAGLAVQRDADDCSLFLIDELRDSGFERVADIPCLPHSNDSDDTALVAYDERRDPVIACRSPIAGPADPAASADEPVLLALDPRTG